jgi:hypothetical protein
MAQQPPLSKAFSVPNSAADPLTIANGFIPSPLITGNTFAIDPNFRVGYAQNWQVSVQRDLPGSLQMTAAYLGIKGTRGPQDFLPNTFPIGAGESVPRLPNGIRLYDFQWQFHARGRSDSVAAQVAQRLDRDPAVHVREIHRRRRGAGRPGS